MTDQALTDGLTGTGLPADRLVLFGWKMGLRLVTVHKLTEKWLTAGHARDRCSSDHRSGFGTVFVGLPVRLWDPLWRTACSCLTLVLDVWMATRDLYPL